MAYVWTDELISGNRQVDEQHKMLFTAVNNFMDACAMGKGRKYIEDTMQFLVDYTVGHFADEEKLQLACKYPGYAAHKKIHDDFKRTAGELFAELKAEGPTIVMVSKVSSIVGNWLVTHIKQEDLKFVKYMKANT
ncbi:MAG: hemerythrin family protein [Oscillospiraceae bacterium]